MFKIRCGSDFRLKGSFSSLHASYEELWANCAVKKIKHKKQESSLINKMVKDGSLDEATHLFELGCGIATLTHHCSLIRSDLCFVVLDRETFRSRARHDYRVRKLQLENEGTFERITTDIKDFDFEKYFEGRDVSSKVVLFSKHFCGSATDVALEMFSKLRQKFDCRLYLCPCCHGKIEEESFFGGTSEELPFLKYCSGWATMKYIEESEDEVCEKTNLSRKEKREIGEKCKIMIDLKRIEELKKRGFEHAKLVKYTNESIENKMIVI